MGTVTPQRRGYRYFYGFNWKTDTVIFDLSAYISSSVLRTHCYRYK